MKKHALCTILYDYEYNLGIDIREVDGGEDDDYSMITVLPAKLRNVKKMEVQVKEDEGGVATNKKFCVNFTATADITFGLGKEKDREDKKGTKNAGFDPKYWNINDILTEKHLTESEQKKKR